MDCMKLINIYVINRIKPDSIVLDTWKTVMSNNIIRENEHLVTIIDDSAFKENKYVNHYVKSVQIFYELPLLSW